MANIIYFLVLAFSRTEEHEFRAEAAIKALSKEHARSAAAHLADYGRGTVAFSIAGEPSTAKWEDPEIIARFGDLPDDCALHQELGRVWPAQRSERNGALARPLANVRPAALSLRRRLWSSAIPISGRQQRSVPGSSKRSLVIAGLVILGLATSGSVMLIRTASAAQREARLMEMARPACIHSGITNDELRHAVRGELEAGTNKKDALRTIVTLCQANARLG
ncbi:hypothetical protein SAMN05519103_09182 [Rhizobiales bacterium GAS113]|nr:hypothetical protein SAMN05519103_09182 [Rhizobiales bacterium GAS113]SEF07598.1 hypothetical protein SAMN05519104_8385 [Rhizobiales bacterium GAS188]